MRNTVNPIRSMLRFQNTKLYKICKAFLNDEPVAWALVPAFLVLIPTVGYALTKSAVQTIICFVFLICTFSLMFLIFYIKPYIILRKQIPLTPSQFSSLGVNTREEAIMYLLAVTIYARDTDLWVHTINDKNTLYKLLCTLRQLPCSSTEFPATLENALKLNSFLQCDTQSLLAKDKHKWKSPYDNIGYYRVFSRHCHSAISSSLLTQLNDWLDIQYNLTDFIDSVKYKHRTE